MAGYRDTFGDDERGRKTAWYFVPFHFNFFHRWRPLERSTSAPSTSHSSRTAAPSTRRWKRSRGPARRGPRSSALLRCAHADAGEAAAGALWSSRSVADAVAAVTALATPENLAAWEQPDAEARRGRGAFLVGGEEAGRRREEGRGSVIKMGWSGIKAISRPAIPVSSARTRPA